MVILTAVFGGFFYLQRSQRSSVPSLSQIISSSGKKNISPSPTPYEFQEITIPFLRKREYKSSLTVGDTAYKNEKYTASLATYTSDGLLIHGLLTRPTAEMPQGGYPAIIFIHGYIPPRQYETTKNYSDYVDFLARNGFVVFKIDLRGHGDSEGEPGGGYYSADYVIDTLSAYNALATSGFVNSKHIGLWGHSMAGNVVMRSFVVRPEIPAVVIWAGAVYSYTDQVEFGIADASYQPLPTSSERSSSRQRIREVYGQPNLENIFWKNIAATSFLSDLKGSIQIHHAVDDPVVNIGYSRNLMKLLDKTSVSHALFEYPSGGHNISGVSFTKAMERTVKFYKDTFEK